MYIRFINQTKSREMSQKRVSSKVKQKQQETKMLEEQTKRMQQKLAALRQQVEQQKKLKQTNHYESTISKWKKASQTDAPLKDYAKKVLADRKEALNKYGINEKKIMGSKSFEPVLSKLKSEKKEMEEKDTTKLPKFQVTSIINKPQQITEPESVPVQSIQNNFFKAKINTKQIIHRKNLQQFLEQNFLQQYLALLNAHGVIDLEDLYHLSREKMNEIGIKPGHQAKLAKRIAEELSGKEGTRQTSNSQKLKSQEKGEKVSFGYGDGNINEYNAINSQQQENKQVRQGEQGPERGQLNNQAQDYSQEQEDQQQNSDEVIITMPQMSEYSLQTGSAEDEKEQPALDQFNCFQCYRKATKCQNESSDSRQFCSSGCLSKYLQFMQKKCPQCDDTFYKFDGYFQDGLWFCSIKCSPNQEKIQQMFIKWGRDNQHQNLDE